MPEIDKLCTWNVWGRKGGKVKTKGVTLAPTFEHPRYYYEGEIPFVIKARGLDGWRCDLLIVTVPFSKFYEDVSELSTNLTVFF